MIHRNVWWPVILLLITSLSWGGMFPVAKHALFELDAFYLTLVRYSAASLFFVLLLLAKEGIASFRFEGRGVQAFLFGSLGFAGFSLLAFDGLRYSSAVHAAIIVAMMPMISVIINWLIHRQRPAAMTLVFVVVAFVGVFLVVSKGDLSHFSVSLMGIGDLMILVAAFCWVYYSMAAAQFPDWSSLRYTTLTCILGTLSIFLCTLIANMLGYIRKPVLQTLLNVSWELAYLIILAAVVAVLCWNKGLKMLGPINGILFINLVPVTAFVISAIQGTSFNVFEILGALLSLSALIANNIYMRSDSVRVVEKHA